MALVFAATASTFVVINISQEKKKKNPEMNLMHAVSPTINLLQINILLLLVPNEKSHCIHFGFLSAMLAFT